MSPPSSDRSPRAVSALASAGGGGDSEHCDRGVTEQSESTNSNNGNAKRSAWSRGGLPNGAIESSPVVMGADSWPSLKESTKPSPSSAAAASSNPKSPPFDSIAAASPDGSPSVSSSSAAPSVPVVANNQMKASNSNPSFNRPKPMKRNYSNNKNQALQINGGPISSPMPPASVETPPTQVLPEKPSPRDMQHNRNSNSNWDHGPGYRGSGFSPHSHGGADHHRPSRRGNNSGGGPHNNGRYYNYSNVWNNPRNMPPPPHPHQQPHLMRQPPPPPPPLSHLPAAPFIGQLPYARPFMGPPMGFAGEIPAHYLYMPTSPAFVTPMGPIAPPSVMFSPIDYQALREAILKQIHFYFSTDNLVRDPYLRRQMNDQGLVHLSVIAGFNKMKELTNNIPDPLNLILDSIRTSEVVEVQGMGIRRRNDWMIWILPSNSSQHGSSSGSSGSHSPSAPNVENTANRLQNVVLGDSNKVEHTFTHTGKVQIDDLEE